MSRRRSVRETPHAPAQPHVRADTGWVRTPETTVNGRTLTPGSEFSVRGERGRFRFQEHVRTAEGVEWLNAIGGATGVTMFRCFRPDRVRTVHRIARTRANAA